MRTSVPILSVTVGAMLLLGCGATGTVDRPRAFVELKIESHPKGWGYAHKTVQADATISGGHLSGGPDAPRVFESKAEVTSQDMSHLRSLVATIAAEEPNSALSRPDQKVQGYTSVVVTFSDGSSTTVFAKWGQRFHSKTIQAIWETVSKYQVGAW